MCIYIYIYNIYIYIYIYMYMYSVLNVYNKFTNFIYKCILHF